MGNYLGLSSSNMTTVPPITISPPIETGISHPQIIDACGGLEVLQALPILDIGNTMGWTDDIDFLLDYHLKAPIMRGFDRYHRPFITFRYRQDTPHHPHEITVETFFQKFPDNRDIWASGTCNYGYEISMKNPIITGGPHTDLIMARLKSLISHQVLHSYDSESPLTTITLV